jgi:hypothetical protein
MGAGGTGIINIMIGYMERGWCFTFIALVCVVVMPMLLVELKWGPIWREERRVRLEKEKDERNKAEQRVVSSESVVDNTETETKRHSLITQTKK